MKLHNDRSDFISLELLDESFFPFSQTGITGKQSSRSQEFNQVGGAGSFLSTFCSLPPTPHIFVYCCVPYAVEADHKKYNI